MISTQEVVPIGLHKGFETLVPLYFQEEVVGVRSPLTAEAKKFDLRRFLEYFREKNGNLLPVDEWLPLDTRSFVGDLVRRGYKPATVNRNLATLRSFATWLEAKRLITLNPCKGIKDLQLEPLAPKAIRDREWFRIQKTAELLALTPQKKYAQGFRNKAILATLNASGLRISELLSLRVDQLVGKRLVDVHCKGDKVRSVLITQEAVEAIEIYLQDHRAPGSDFLFTNRYGGRLSRNGVGEALHRIAAHANVKLPRGEAIHLRSHLLRHRHAYQARKIHGDVFAAKRLGHASLRHLERYAGLTEQEEQDLIERM